MLIPTIVDVIGIVVFTFTVIFCIKNFLMDFKESDSFIKNILLKTIIVVLLLSSAFFIGAGLDLKGILIRLATEIDQMSIEEIAMLNHLKLIYQKEIIVFAIVQVISLTILFILFQNIKKEIIAYSKTRKHWDWKKIK